MKSFTLATENERNIIHTIVANDIKRSKEHPPLIGKEIYKAIEEAIIEQIEGSMDKVEYNCFNCPYYHPENNTCNVKKCSSTTGGDGCVTKQDMLYCNFYKSDDKNKLGENND